MRVRQLAVLLALVQSSAAFWPFKQKRFTAEGLHSAGSLGLPADVGRVIAIGDVDGDQNSDLFVLSKDAKTVQVYLWSRDAFKYKPGTKFEFKEDVVNVVPGDFNGDGRLDMLVMTQVGGSWWSGASATQTDMVVLLSSADGFGAGERWELAPSTLQQPIVFDDDGTLVPSLLGFMKSDTGPRLTSWRNSGSGMKDGLPPVYPQGCEVVPGHSSAFIDLDGDCAPDVVLHCQRAKANARGIQVYTAQGENGYTLAKTLELPAGSRSISFADMNRNGAMDMVFPTCKKHMISTGRGEECSIDIAYNFQVPLCPHETSRYTEDGQLSCRGWGQLCQADTMFDFLFYEEHFLSIPVTELFGHNFEILLSVPGNKNIPLPLRPGDMSVNGFPDVLLTGVEGSKHRVKVLRNVPCSKGVAGCGDKWKPGQRGFVVAGGKGWEALERIDDAEGASWIDLDDDGTLDILVHRTGKQDGERVTFIQNNFYHDAFFLKAQALNGACDHECKPKGGKAYSAGGVSYSGATFKATTFDTEGKRHAQSVSQLAQTTYQALLSPHVFLGLGRTNNYIENLQVGMSMHSDHKTKLESLIPNSQVITNPPWPKRDAHSQLERSREWRSELFLHPGDWVPWVAAAVIGTVVTLGMVVVWLGEREKRADEKERRRALHAINFQAL